MAEHYVNRDAAAAAHLQYGITLAHSCLQQFAVKSIEDKGSTITADKVTKFKTSFHDFNQTVHFILNNWKKGGFEQGCKKILKSYLLRCKNVRNDVSHQANQYTDNHDRKIEDLCPVVKEIGFPREADSIRNFMRPQPLVKTSWEQLKQLANEHFKEGRYTEAMISYTEALKEKPDEPTLYSNRALCEINLERYEDARNDAEDALNLDGNTAKYYRILSEALMKLGNLEEALSACERGLEIDPRDGAILVRQRDIQAMLVMKITNQHPRTDAKGFMENTHGLADVPSNLLQRFFGIDPDPKDILVLTDAQFNEHAKFVALLREGHSYVYGARERPKDLKKAFRTFKEVADLGCAEGQYNLGVLYANGQGTNTDYALMFRYYQLAANQKPFKKWRGQVMPEIGVAEAENALGNAYRDGRGVDVDLKKAFSHYQKAANWGQPEAENNMGFCFVNGLGVTRNMESARSWYERAAKAGIAEAEMNYAELLERGWGGPVDEQGAFEYFQKAAQQGMQGAIDALHRMSLRGSANKHQRNAFENTLEKSTAKKDVNALFFKGNKENELRNYDEAIIYYKEAADLGHLESKIELWKLLLHQKRQNADAFLHCSEASQTGDAISQQSLAKFYATGTGCTRDPEAAQKWFRRALHRIPQESCHHISQEEFDETLRTAEVVCSYEEQSSLVTEGLKWEERLLRYLDTQDASKIDRKISEKFQNVNRLNERSDQLPFGTNIPKQLRKDDMFAVMMAAENGSVTAQNIVKARMMNAEALQSWALGNHDRAFALLRKSQKFHDIVEIRNPDMVAYIEKHSVNTPDAMFVKACHFVNDTQGAIHYVQRCIRLHPKEADFHNLLANLYLAAERSSEALASAQLAYKLEARPNWLYTIATAMLESLLEPSLRRNTVTGDLYEKTSPTVLDAYFKYLSENPSDARYVPSALFGVAYLYLIKSKNDLDKVRQYYDKACAADKQRLPCFEAVKDGSSRKSTVHQMPQSHVL
ncbi:uncharacterized protein LOC129589555 isoform X2 [Paramacrobiotus metropolitanus]|uniref:uncharacterized protein LOC129589555 isoform X2 n=1 Tax=Paramacrobiotus metropolitanus TaxID=2943436 RepID=UPI0024459EA5|nr:uncharacterized protein LOC129589555 isoform X2 [Paramacrobiotus metropolitanus]